MRPFTRRAAFALAILPLLWGPSSAQQPAKKSSATGPQTVVITAEPITAFNPRDPSQVRFGALDFRGGLVLRSSNRDFGGVSGIRVQPDGNFIAVIDRGRWLRGRITYDGTRPTGIANAQMAPILGADGRPLAARGWYDTEALADDGSTLYVGIERVHQIVRFDFARGGLAARGQAIELPAIAKTFPVNLSFEALAFVPKGQPLGGTLIALSESALDTDGNIISFLIGGPSPGAFAVKRTADFDISDAALIPGGDLLILERKFSWLSGIAIRIRRLAHASLRPDATVDGRILFEADLGHQVDNMEALSVHRAATGETVLTLVSDDNFSMIQRNLLLQFTLAEE